MISLKVSARFQIEISSSRPSTAKSLGSALSLRPINKRLLDAVRDPLSVLIVQEIVDFRGQVGILSQPLLAVGGMTRLDRREIVGQDLEELPLSVLVRHLAVDAGHCRPALP